MPGRLLKGWRRSSLRTRIILMVAGTLLVAMVASGIMVRQLVSQNIIGQKLVTVEILTTSIVHDITYNNQRGEEASGPQVVEKYMTYYRIIRDLTLYDRNLVATAAADPHRMGTRAQEKDIREAVLEARPTLEVSRPNFKNFGIRSVSPILQGSHIIGAVVLDVSMMDVQQTLASMDRRLALVMGGILAMVAGVLFMLLRASVLLRLRRLMRVTQEIRAGHYEVRIDDNAGDEIGSLAQALDQMAAELQTSRRQIDDYNRHLEDRVQEATAELAKAYENLKNAQGQLVLNEKMASLGVLIAGVAHEINTPVGAILNVSRNLLQGLQALPQDLAAFRERTAISPTLLVECLRYLLATACTPRGPVSYKTQRAIEVLLEEQGVTDGRRCAATLCRLGVIDPETIRRYAACFNDVPFFALAESCASVAQAAMIAQTSSEKIAEIVKALKYYAYSDKDRVDVIQINDSLATALVLLRNQFRHALNVTVDLAPNLPTVACSSDIHQVWTNLLTNAHDAVTSRSDGGRGEIAVSTSRRDESIVVTVADNGVGIPKESVDRIFDPFYTTKDIGKGTGLGLSIVSGIVKKHNGGIRVESEPGRTVFEITLPIQAAAHADTSTPNPTDAPDDAGNTRKAA